MHMQVSVMVSVVSQQASGGLGLYGGGTSFLWHSII